MDYLKTRLQYLVPQHFLSYWVGRLTLCRHKWLKNWMINTFIKRYQVAMQEAVEPNPVSYATFHDFFIRKLNKSARPIVHDANAIASPVDGCVSQLGKIDDTQLIQAKGFHFDLNNLLAQQTHLIEPFRHGEFCTLYLAPRDYHHVHMPLTGTLQQMIYVPGKLFSVNPATTRHVPQLFSRNERVICYFNTEKGPMIVILVGALLVGSISVEWAGKINANGSRQLQINNYPLTPSSSAITLQRGENMGYFSLGSTVILLFPPNTMKWEAHLKTDANIKMGESIGILQHS
jgi:phosphatidylserine decarboxylase